MFWHLMWIIWQLIFYVEGNFSTLEITNWVAWSFTVLYTVAMICLQYNLLLTYCSIEVVYNVEILLSIDWYIILMYQLPACINFSYTHRSKVHGSKMDCLTNCCLTYVWNVSLSKSVPTYACYHLRLLFETSIYYSYSIQIR